MNSSNAIAALITNRGLCRECIAQNAKMTPEAVDTAIGAMSRALKVYRYANGTCLGCHTERLVFAIDRPS